MRSKQDLALIWRHTHRDYRGKIEGVRYILICRDGQGTCSVALDALTDAEFERELASARAREARVGIPMRNMRDFDRL